MQQLFKNTACSSIFKDTQLVLAIVCFFFFACVCLPSWRGIHSFLGAQGYQTFAAAHTHTSTSDLTIHSTVIYWCDPSLSCFIMATHHWRYNSQIGTLCRDDSEGEGCPLPSSSATSLQESLRAYMQETQP